MIRELNYLNAISNCDFDFEFMYLIKIDLMHCLVHSFYFVNVKKLKKLLQIRNDIYIAAKKSYKRVLLEQLGSVYRLPHIIAILFSSNKIIGQLYTAHRRVYCTKQRPEKTFYHRAFEFTFRKYRLGKLFLALRIHSVVSWILMSFYLTLMLVTRVLW